MDAAVFRCSSDSWATVSTGYVSASQAVSVGKIWLRLSMDARANGDNLARFYSSKDGSSFQQLGGTLTLDNTFDYFIGYRYAIFDFATRALAPERVYQGHLLDSKNSSTGAPTNTVTSTTVPPTTTSTTSCSGGGGAAQSEWGQCGGAAKLLYRSLGSNREKNGNVGITPKPIYADLCPCMPIYAIYQTREF
jgi:hypothetical protein